MGCDFLSSCLGKYAIKKINDHPIVVGAYAQWLVSTLDSKEALEAKTLEGKLNYHVDEISATFYSTTKRISKLNTTV